MKLLQAATSALMSMVLWLLTDSRRATIAIIAVVFVATLIVSFALFPGELAVASQATSGGP